MDASPAFILKMIARPAMISREPEMYAQASFPGTLANQVVTGGLPAIKSFSIQQRIPSDRMPMAKMMRPGFISLFI